MSGEKLTQLPIYLDYAATTPVDPRVAEKMAGCLKMDGIFGNPASRSHLYGWKAEEAVELARSQAASLINADAREIVWTSGATEADNLALKGAAHFYRDKGMHIVSSCIEHKAVLDSLSQLEREGFEVTYLQPDRSGVISAQSLEQALRADTILVSLMHVNNEIGVINDIASLGEICRARGVLFHVDAAQSLGKIDIDLAVLAVDLMSFSAHKIYGPKGAGALYVGRNPMVRLEPQQHGGGHERGMRSGTLATHQIVGTGEAFAIAGQRIEQDRQKMSVLSERLLQGLLPLGGVRLNGDTQWRVPHILNLAFSGVDGEALLLGLKDIAVSSGSACTSASLEPSYVLRALGLEDGLAHSALRFSLGRYTTEQEIDFTIEHVSQVLRQLRKQNSA